MSTTLADDDVVASWKSVPAGARSPLIVLDELENYLAGQGLEGPITRVDPLGDGHSNVTVLLHVGQHDFVLRRPPRPPWQPSAHNVLRESRILKALAETSVPVPAILAECNDSGVIGAPFYIMNQVPGDVITHATPKGFDSRRDGAEIGRTLIQALVDIHAVDFDKVGLSTLGRPNGYLNRQVERFTGLWQINQTRELAEIDKVGSWLATNIPASTESSIIHGDFRPGNLLFTPAPVAVGAVLDWEMSTLGDPLADLGYLLALWAEPQDSPWMFDLSPATREPGYPSRASLSEQYSAISGRDVRDLRFYATLALWKSAVIMEGNYKRSLEGTSDDPFLREFKVGVEELAERAHRLGPGGSTMDY